MGFATPITCRKAVWDGGRTYVVGVLNVTPDSFSDGGKFVEVEAAVARGVALAEAGADLIDVGGESTRPGFTPVPANVEAARVVPVIEALARRVSVPISIDTYKWDVAEAALAAGAEVVNDVSGGGQSVKLLEVCGEAGAPLVLGHWMIDGERQHGDVFEDVVERLETALFMAREVGVRHVIADPGLGFGKTRAHNLTLIRRAGELSQRLGAPVMVGPSRKRFLGEITGLGVGERLVPTLGAAVAAALCGADFVRVHDVAEARAALAVADAVRRAA